jgi:uncharacterized OB-fold protein
MSVATAAPPERPLPTPTRESQPFWDGLREGRFMLQHCTSCSKLRHYPRPVCPHCLSMDSTFKEAPTGGAIHSWTVCHHPFNFFFKGAAPYIVALVDMDAGVRVNAPLRGIAETDLKIGRRVRLGFESVNKEVTLPFFIVAGCRPSGTSRSVGGDLAVNIGKSGRVSIVTLDVRRQLLPRSGTTHPCRRLPRDGAGVGRGWAGIGIGIKKRRAQPRAPAQAGSRRCAAPGDVGGLEVGLGCPVVGRRGLLGRRGKASQRTTRRTDGRSGTTTRSGAAASR